MGLLSVLLSLLVSEKAGVKVAEDDATLAELEKYSASVAAEMNPADKGDKKPN
jgi:hypothetical protein